MKKESITLSIVIRVDCSAEYAERLRKYTKLEVGSKCFPEIIDTKPE